MTISVLLSGLPTRSMAQAAFDAATEQFMTDLPTFGAQVNATAAGLNSIAAGGAFAIPYNYSGSAGLLKFGVSNSAAMGSSTLLYLGKTNAASQSVTGLIDNFAASSSAAKGQVRVTKVGDTSKWMVFSSSTITSYTDYYTLAVTPIAASSAGALFVEGDSVVLHFQRTGDKGDTGVPYNVLHVRDERASGTAAPAATTGTTTRTINTTKVNSIAGASLASNQITLPAGTYDFQIFAGHAYISGAPFLYNVTDAAVAISGMAHLASTSVPSGVTPVQGRVTIAATKVFELRHAVTATAATPTFGFTVTSGHVEIFLDIFVSKGS